jgi:hypothetical protein
MGKTEMLPPLCPPGREIHEVFGETKASKKATTDWRKENEHRKKHNGEIRKKGMTLIEQSEAGLR